MIKLIKFNRETKDFDCYLGAEYVGSRSRRIEAEALLDSLVYARLTRQAVA